jgi:hypothetical protein
VKTARLSLPSTKGRELLARDLERADERPVGWCVVDWASEASIALADRLVDAWGPGLCYQAGVPWSPTRARAAVLPPSAVSKMLRVARARLWWSDDDMVDRERAMESIEHGCLPLQVTHAEAETAGPDSNPLCALLLRASGSRPLPALSDVEIRARLDAVATALTSGLLERALDPGDG